jgi:hypothetical protein
MTDFGKTIQIRIEKAAERTLAEKLNAVDWEQLPVKKVLGGTLLAFAAWKFGLPLVRSVIAMYQWVCLGLAFLLVYSIVVVLSWAHPEPRTTGVDNATPIVQVDNTPAPRAELVHHRRH